jgi:hyaluronoglucosaminidase
VAPGIPHETDPAIDLSDTNTTAIGRGGVVRIPYALEISPYGPWSVEAWVKPDSNDTHGNFRTVLSSLYNFNFSTAVYGWAVYQHPNGGSGAWTLAVFNGTGGPSFFGSDFGHIPLVPASWYHLVLTDDGSTIQLYVNGVAGSANTSVAGSGFIPNGINGDPSLSASSIVLGQRSDGAYNGFSGGVDEVAFYNHALTSQQIQAHLVNSFPLNFAQYGTDLVLTWSVGTLQSAPAATGAYTAVSGATSPYTNSVSGGTKFYRLQIQ